MNRVPGTRVLFSPKGGTSKELTRLIKATKKEIAVAVFAFSSKYLGQALSAAFKRGVKVRIILDGDNARKAYSLDEWLIGAGIEVRFIEPKGGSMHHKFMLIDGKMLITGSYNFTNESEFRNHEAAIFTNHKALLQSFTAEFENLWRRGATTESTVTSPGTAAAGSATSTTVGADSAEAPIAPAGA